jgi:hypothetical protein
MGTPLNTGGGTAGPPAIKLRNVGDSVGFAVVDITLNVPVKQMGSNEIKRREDGSPFTQHVLTVLVTDPGQAVKVEGELYVPFPSGELGSIFISSYAKYDPDRDKITAPFKSWGGITDEVGLEVGYVGQWKFLEELAPTRAGNNGRKDRKFRLRPPKPEEAAQAARCEELHRQLQERTVLQPAGAPAVDPGPFDPDDF